MGIRGWYYSEGNTSGRGIACRNSAPGSITDSSYTEFHRTGLNMTDSSYTDLTVQGGKKTDLRNSNGSRPACKNAVAKHKKRKLSARGKAVFTTFGMFMVLGAAAAGVYIYLNSRSEPVKVNKEVVIEAGSVIRIEDFFADMPSDARFLTDVTDIDTNVPAIYQLKVTYEKAFEEDVTLKIEDHTGPVGTAVAQTVYTMWKMPEAEECVDDLYDLSGISKISYLDDAPVFNAGGIFDVPVVVTDMYGNDTEIDVPFTVIDDRSAPVIEGVHDIEIDGDAGTPDLLKGIFAYDDYDTEPLIRVNDALVNYNKSGEYEISYSAMDKAGNVSTVKAKLKINKLTSDTKNVSDESSSGNSGNSSSSDSDSSTDPAYGLAENIMSSLWRSNDTDTARAIFNWVHSHISYMAVSSYMTYEEAAYRGFTKRNGDCYVYFSCAKMLLDTAGIPNMMVERFPVYTNGHYWNLVQLDGEWYHCDATVFKDHPGVYFMCTDDEIDDSHHSFNGALYPERAGGSSEHQAAPTPEPTPEPTAVPAEVPTPTDTPVTTPDNEPPKSTDSDNDPSVTSDQDVVTVPHDEPVYSDDDRSGTGENTGFEYGDNEDHRLGEIQ